MSPVFISLLFLPAVVHCYYDPEPPKPYGAKTLYDWSLTEEEIAVRNETTLPAPSVCRPLYVGSFIRHGTRNPSIPDLERASDLMNRIGGQIQAPEYAFLNDWEFPFTPEEESALVPVGYRQNVGIGRRWAERVQPLLEGASEQEVTLVSSSKQRNIDSAEGFRQGVAEIVSSFGGTAVTVDDRLTRFYEFCPRRDQEVVENPDRYAQVLDWMAGPEMAALSRELSQRLQLGVSDLFSSDLYAIYMATAFEQGIRGSSNWTNLWASREEIETVEYVDDFVDYWDRGYGYSINSEQSCVVLEQLFTQMDEVRAANEAGSSLHPKLTFLFGHSPSIVPLETLLGLFNDSLPILADNYPDQADRTFRSSRIDNAAASLAFTLYECDEGAHGEDSPEGVEWPAELERFMIQFFFNEMSMLLPNTCEYDLCSYEQVRIQLSEFIDTCNFEERCAAQ